MKICYVDESGCTGQLPSATSNIQPALIVTGIIIDYAKLHEITERLLTLKQRFFPKALPSKTTHMAWILHEIKGSELRKKACSDNRNERRHSLGYMQEILNICKSCNVKITGRLWVKSIGTPINGVSIYTFSIQSIYNDFQNYLATNNDVGFVVLDSRLKHLNTPVAHSIFTQKFKGSGDAYDRIIELPAFSHSDNHAGLQLCDTICSSVVTPMAIHTYCSGHITSVHVKPRYINIKDRFAADVASLQHRYTEASGRVKGGLIVSDPLGKKPGGALFR
ncbi:DUF3800 domain-containing protein [Agrobacterium sp. rho-13.3]|uniref:DUF3800 domain-containing protein n=1 Tax=Agrobacterium sp. rho-13.3 TaxID=3072980 RepID=UPI002A0CD6EE|nr:DUF3800 domain-containing protein [Agrobacterium sp. rho-13.3]MDX8306200.1 DUF3800 domain-containing protein [Agrobacterium sp. rho-13.3]MDX8307469.1 DUF3800 domain-containing protein [Agrobacterium sp. rho-13.3]